MVKSYITATALMLSALPLLAGQASAQDRFEANTRGYFGGYSTFGGYYDTFGSYGGISSYGYRRYNQVFQYHNGAESYYAARAFRGSLRI